MSIWSCGSEGDHLGQDQALGGGHADGVALPSIPAASRVGERSGVKRKDRLEPVDPYRSRTRRR